MTGRRLAEAIQSYLDEDDSSGGNGSSTAVAAASDDSRSQLQALTRTCDQLKADMSSLKNNLQMALMLPILLNQKVTVVGQSSGYANLYNDQLTLQPTDKLTSLLPMFLLGGMGDSSGSNGDNSNMMWMVIALSGALG